MGFVQDDLMEMFHMLQSAKILKSQIEIFHLIPPATKVIFLPS
jgi:hypothetical protein